MRIARLDLIRYGNFADRHYDFPASPADFQVLYGANEAGKSTTLSAISDLLFGFPNLKSQDWLFDASMLRVGATLEQDNTQLAIIRKRGRAQTLLAPDDTTPLDENALISWLGSVDRAAFERMWSLDHQRLRAGGDAMARFEGDLGQQLLAAGFGLENVQSVLDALDTKAGAIWKKGGRGTKLGELKKAFDTARSDLLAAERARDTWTALNNEARAIEASRKDLEEAITALRHERARLERLKRLRTELIELDGLNAFLQAAPAPLFTPQEHEQFDHLLHRWTDAVQKRNDLQQVLDGLTETRAGYQPDLDLLSHETEIRAFRTRFEALGHRQTDHEEETQLNGMEAALQAGGYTGTAEEILSHLPGEELLAQLRPLARSYDALGLREENWRRNYNAARENLARAEASLGADIPPALRPLQNALEQAAAVRDIDTTINTLERTLRETRTQMDQSLRDLLPWQDDPQMLDPMAVPEPGFLETQRDNWREREKTIALLREAIRTLDDERERHLLEKAQIEQRDIVSLATLNQERAQRNGLFDALMTAPYDTQKRDAYLASRLLADQSADRRFDNAEILARLSQTDHAVERCILERKQQASRLDALIEAHNEAEREWREVLTERGLPLLPPDHLPGWLALRQKALEIRTRFGTLKTEHEAATRTRETILSTLRALLPDLAPYDTLSDTLIDARKQSLDREKEAARFAEREKEHDIARATLQARQYEGEAIAQDRKNLESRWHEVLPDTPVWSLDEVQKLTDLRQKANTLAYRRAALTAYRAEIATLEEEFRLFMVSLDREDDLVLTTPMAAVSALYEALLSSRQDREHADRQDAQIREKTEACATVDTALERLRDEFVPFLQRLETTSIEMIRPVLEEESRYYRAQDDRKQREHRISEQSDGFDLAQLQSQARETDPDLIATRLDALDSEQNELEQQRNAAFSRSGAIRESLRKIENDEAALKAAAEIESCQAEMAHAAEEWAQARIQTLVLTHVAKRQRLENSNPLLRAAERLFSSFTCGRYQKLVIDDEGKTPKLSGMLQNEKMVCASAMSEGTRDQLYLSLRLAALEQARMRGFTLPFIADDLFITFDEARAEAGFATLNSIARHQQILFMTHHTHLAEMAGQFGATRHSV